MITNILEKQNIIYTEEQQKAITKIVEFVRDRSGFIRLVGSAGVGKTCCLKEIVDRVAALSIPITIISPTHKAKKVAEKSINRDRDPNDTLANYYEPITLAKALGQIPTIKIEDGQKMFVQNGKPTMLGGLIIVDEASMVSETALTKLEDLVEDTATVLFVLDPIQLPPVKSKTSEPPVYLLNIEEALLTKPQRFYADSTIGTITTQVRKKDIYLSNFNWSGFATYCKDKPDVNIYSNESKFEDAFLEDMEAYDWSNNPDSVRLLSYTNKQVDKYNSLVARLYFDNNTSNYVSNEVLIARSPFVRTDLASSPSDVFNSSAKDTVHFINNGEEFKLLEQVSTGTFTHPSYIDKPVEYFVWKAEKEDGEIFTTNIVSAKGKKNFKYISSELNAIALAIPHRNHKKKKKAWKEKYRFIHSFDDCRRAYALTIHSSQGSTMENVYLDLSLLDIPLASRVRRGLVYTAMTRPTTYLNIYIPPQYVANSILDTIR